MSHRTAIRTVIVALLVGLSVVPMSAVLADYVPADCEDGQWEIRPNQTLGTIAWNCKVKVADIIAYNNLTNPNLVNPGTVLLIPPPGWTAPAQPVAPVQPAASAAPVATATAVAPASQPAVVPPVAPAQPSQPPAGPTPLPGDVIILNPELAPPDIALPPATDPETGMPVTNFAWNGIVHPGDGALQPPSPSSSLPGAVSGPNLVRNPSFEEPYYRISTPEVTAAVANNWIPWWWNDPGSAYQAPEFEIAPRIRDPFRVRSGNAAQVLFRPYVLHRAGVWQRIQVPANSTVRFTIYGHAWGAFCAQVGDARPCDPRNSAWGDGANPISLKVGIDPYGGRDIFAGNVIWADPHYVWDNFAEFSVQVKAVGDFVTVYTYSEPLFPAQVNNVYWDDAALYIVK